MLKSNSFIILILFFIILLHGTAYSQSLIKTTEPQEIFEQLTLDQFSCDDGGFCFARADIWSYQIFLMTGKYPKKIVMIYSDKASPFDFSYHVAPIYHYEGSSYVLDKFFESTKPLTIDEWQKKLNGELVCEKLEKMNKKIKRGINRKKLEDLNYFSDILVKYKDEKKCFIFEEEVDFYSPEFGFLGEYPNNKSYEFMFSKERVFNGCVTITEQNLINNFLNDHSEKPKVINDKSIMESIEKLAEEICFDYLNSLE